MMPLPQTSIRQRRLARRMVDYLIEPAKALGRRMLHRDQIHHIAGQPVILPPGHFLPWFQRRDPTYDRYAETVIAALCDGYDVTVVDLGGNVGDTAVAVLGSDPDVKVVSIEGNPEFTRYLARNIAPFGPRARHVEAFVGPIPGIGSYVSHGTSGAFSEAPTTATADPVAPG